MVETLNVTGDASSMLANRFEPKRKNRWILEIDGVDAFLCKTSGQPSITFDETVIDWINVKRKLAGKGNWGDISVVLYDPIAPSGAQQIMEWIRLCFESVSGRAGYADMYKRDLRLKLLDPVGTVVSLWDLRGCFCKEINMGDLDYASSDPNEISVTIAMDNCILQM